MMYLTWAISNTLEAFELDLTGSPIRSNQMNDAEEIPSQDKHDTGGCPCKRGFGQKA